MGRFECVGEFAFRQIPNWVALHLVMEGCGTVSVGGRPLAIKAGDLFAFFPGQVPGRLKNEQGHSQQPWSYTWAGLDGAQAEAVMAHCGLDRARPIRSGAFHK